VSEEFAAWIWIAFAGYLSLGSLLWIALSLGLMQRLDASAAAASWPVKALIAPGLIALWPAVLMLLFKPKKPAS
jgi:hypothetical protein